MTDTLIAAVDNGRRENLTSSLYTGKVGVRDRGDGQLELAWFGVSPTLTTAIDGELGDVGIRITAIRARDLRVSQAQGPRQLSPKVCAIVATAQTL